MDLIKKSVNLVNKNMVMLVPFLLQLLLMGGIVIVSIFGSSMLYFTATSNDVAYLPLIMVALTIVIISMFIQSFVMSGTVGMGKEVMEKGSTQLDDFFSYGKKYYLKVLLIELLGTIISLLVMLPMFIYLLANIDNFLVVEKLPALFFIIYLGCGLVAAVVYFIAHFSIVPLVKDEMGVWAAIGNSFRILPKGFKDCMILLGVTIAVMIMFVIVSLLLSFIPIVGQLLISAIQFYFVVILLMWSLAFYDKHKEHDNQKEEVEIVEEK